GDGGKEGLAVVGMLADLARERKQSERAVEIDVVGGEALRQAGALGLLAFGRFAELDVWPEAARAQRHFQPARRVLAELFHPAVGSAVGAVAGRELARVAALGVIGAADETAEFAELEREPAGLATRAFARIGTVRARRKQMRCQHLVERVDDLGDAQLLDVAHGGGELTPKIPQQV